MQTNIVPLWDQLPQNLDWNEKVAYLAYQFKKVEQPTCPLTHRFERGLYIREIRIPANNLIIGRVHRHGHVCQLLEGDILLIHRGGQREGFRAPSQILTQPGYQIVAHAVTDVVAQTVHPNPNDERDIEKLETDIFESLEGLMGLGERVEERVLYAKMLAEHGIDEDALRPLIEDETDQIPFHGEYPVQVGPSPLHGLGILATQPIAAGSCIAPARIAGKRTPVGRYTNHGSKPNAQMKRSARGDIELVSLSDIPPGVEILVDYRHAFQIGRQS